MPNIRPKARAWRVRHAYPDAVVALVRILTAQRAVREVAVLLDIPPSVIYRWRAKQATHTDDGCARTDSAQTVAALIAHCNARGFRIAPQALRALGQPATHAPGYASEPVPRRDTTTVAAGTVEAPARAPAKRRYVFDANRERAARGVRRRLEAARREIDARYFAPLDCRMLADTARMSRHHFIRMFGDLFGMSPYRYLLHVRVRAAKRLLLCSREPIEVIAAGVGFRSGPSLTRAFKQSEGASVSTFCQSAPLPPP